MSTDTTKAEKKAHYRGRFAPSPTGPLHFGSLVAAVASYADARHHHGTWVIRIDDVDQTRCDTRFERDILDALGLFGMQSDETPIRQSDRAQRYREVLDSLAARRLAYRCTCSRKQVRENARVGIDGPIYDGTCKQVAPPSGLAAAWRVLTHDSEICFDDRIAGRHCQCIAKDVGDYVIQRVDGYTAYQLAVVVDDNDQAITDIVRGADLLASTPRQIMLQHHLGYATPRYAHVPLVADANGKKLSKQDGAHAVDPHDPIPALLAAWRFLGQRMPPTDVTDIGAFWQWASATWHIDDVKPATASNHD